jgi:hypothetical protein
MKNKEVLEDTMKIGIAESSAEKLEIYRFRYHIYAEEMSRQLPSADHANKLLYDELDEWAILLYAKIGAELVGTMRINIGALADFPLFWAQTLSLERFQKFYEGKNEQQFGYSSKMMISPRYRNSAVCYLLVAKAYDLYCEYRVQFNFCVSNLHVLGVYEQIGFRRYGNNFVDADYGLLVPFVALVDDIEHLRAVKSPLLRNARKREIMHKQAAEWFCDEFIEYSHIINSQLVTEDELWFFLHHQLGYPPHHIMSALNGLSETEARKFLHRCSVVVQCRAGDHILARGQASFDVNILLSGKLQSRRSSIMGFKNVLPGQHFGANGLINNPKQSGHIIAATAAEILVLSSLPFARLLHSHPKIAHKVLQNLDGRTGLVSTVGA